MKVFRSLIIFSIAIIGLSFVNVNAQDVSNNDLTAQQEMEKKVFKKIIAMPYYGVFDNIKFQVDGDTVILSGKVYNGINRSSAAKRIKKIDGIENVVNNIEILPPSRFDDTIRRRTVREFANGGSLYRYLQSPNPSVRIIVDNGHVTLEGFVSNSGDYKLANILAKTVPGTFTVTNNLEVTKDRKY